MGSSNKVSLNREATAAMEAHRRRLAAEWSLPVERVTASAVVLHLTGARAAQPRR